MASKKSYGLLVFWAVLGIAVSLCLVWLWQSQPGYRVERGFPVVEEAYKSQQSGLMADVSGQVVRILPESKENPPLQKFVIRLLNDQSIIVIHDLSEAEHVPVSINDTVAVRGQYRWNETGGTIQFTYRDSSPKRMHGWIEHQGNRYD